MLAAMMAALMSSLTSVFNSSSSIFTMDIWKRIRPRSSEGELLVVGRVFVLVLVGVSIAWIPVLQQSQGGQLFNYIQSVTGYLAPPVLSLYLLAMIWSRTNEAGAFWGMMIGLLVGLIRMGLDFGYGSPNCGEKDFRPTIISKVHFLHFTIILFFVSLLATIIISLCTNPINSKHIVRLTWWTRHSIVERVLFDEEVSFDRKAQEREPAQSKPMGELPRWRWIVNLLCGYEPPKEHTISEEEKKEALRALTSIKEERKWKYFVNINALILLTIGMFLWGFYS
ncbi:hypothetical protein CHS0354_013334 [Potamilus streckersoni]|uniref:Sodium/glucose cotransporter 4 n=1 Tax=Potamilus streckersoni TaxID=2493646 RepID=A0AAE0W6M0_9BIVA|nr:hypothetical protein CHS0354_013334 [Potamilus streckersoni]